MSILVITFNGESHTESELSTLVTAVGNLYAASLGCLSEQVRVFVDHRGGEEEFDYPNIEFLVPDGTPLAEDCAGVENLKRQFDHLLGMWPHATEMLNAVNLRSNRKNKCKQNEFTIGRNAT